MQLGVTDSRAKRKPARPRYSDLQRDMAAERKKYTEFCSTHSNKEAFVRVREIDDRDTRFGRFITLSGIDQNGRPILAEYNVPVSYGSNVGEAVYQAFHRAAEFKMFGYWKQQADATGRKRYVFKAIFATGIDLNAIFQAVEGFPAQEPGP